MKRKTERKTEEHPEPKTAKCSKCGMEFEPKYQSAPEPMCQECTDDSKCYACGMVIGSNCVETDIAPIGDHFICGSCDGKLKRKGFLHIQCAEANGGMKGLFLFPDGTAKKFTLEEEKEFLKGVRK